MDIDTFNTLPLEERLTFLYTTLENLYETTTRAINLLNVKHDLLLGNYNKIQHEYYALRNRIPPVDLEALNAKYK
jgi:hypothetical protein